MPGLYLGGILVALAGIAVIDVRFRLALRPAPGRTIAAVAIGTAALLATDLLAIASGVFVQGGSPLYLGVDLAPELPLEEPFFLLFLSYLALVAWAAANRILDRRRPAADAKGGSS